MKTIPEIENEIDKLRKDKEWLYEVFKSTTNHDGRRKRIH